MIRLTSHPPWIKEFLDSVAPFKDRIVNHRMFIDISTGTLTLKQFQSALVYFYPLIESFPKYLALILAKVPVGRSIWSKRSASWLSHNIEVERLHSKWWLEFACGFNIPPTVIEGDILPPAEMDAINNYLWRICTYGSFVEAISATNFAIEGPTGEWAKQVQGGFDHYRGMDNVEINKKTLKWVVAHASYDDKHPFQALEIIKAFAKSDDEKKRVVRAAKASLDYYALALDYAYSHIDTITENMA